MSFPLLGRHLGPVGALSHQNTSLREQNTFTAHKPTDVGPSAPPNFPSTESTRWQGIPWWWTSSSSKNLNDSSFGGTISDFFWNELGGGDSFLSVMQHWTNRRRRSLSNVFFVLETQRWVGAYSSGSPYSVFAVLGRLVTFEKKWCFCSPYSVISINFYPNRTSCSPYSVPSTASHYCTKDSPSWESKYVN